MTVRFGLRAPRVGRTAQRAGPAVLRTAKAQPIRPRARPHAPLKRRRTRHIRAGRDNSSPPAVNATSSDELQPAPHGGELRDSASRNYNAPFTAPVLRGSSSERPPAPLMRRSRRGRRFREPRYSLSAQSSAKKHSPTHRPILRPVSASLRLRCRSAAFSRACAIHSISAVSRNS